jgi:hypothetical protein
MIFITILHINDPLINFINFAKIYYMPINSTMFLSLMMYKGSFYYYCLHHV